MSFLGIKGRFTFYVSTLLGLLLLLFCSLVYGAVRDQLMGRAIQEFDQHMQHEWRHFVGHYGHAHAHGGHDTLPHPFVYIEIWDQDNRMQVANFDAPPSWTKKSDVMQRVLHQDNQDKSYLIKGWFYPQEVAHYLVTLKYILGLACSISILLLLPICYFLIYSLLGPFRSLARGMEGLDAQTLSFRFPEERIVDEYSSLLKSINILLSRLERSFENTKSFASRASHELRTPMTILRGEVELVLRKPRERADYEQALTRVLAQAKKLQDLIVKLLLFADVDRLKLTQEDSPIEFEPLLDNCWQGLTMVHSRPGVALDKKIRHGALRGSVELVECVVKNLLENSLKFSRSKIAVSTTSTADGFELKIEDDGPGVPDQERSSVLNPFVKLPFASQSSQTGYGLGLSIVKTAVEAMGGTITLAKSALGGLQVEVRLP